MKAFTSYGFERYLDTPDQGKIVVGGARLFFPVRYPEMALTCFCSMETAYE